MQNIVGKFDALRERMPKCVRKNEDAAGDGERSAVSGVQRQSISCGNFFCVILRYKLQNTKPVLQLGERTVAWTQNNVNLSEYCFGESDHRIDIVHILGFCIQAFDGTRKGTVFNAEIWFVLKMFQIR